MTPFQRFVGALSTMLLLVVAGCSDPDPAVSTPTASPTIESPSPSAAPSSSEPARPETAKEFIRRWPVVETEMINTGETEAYRAITKSCDPCTALAERVAGFYAKGGYARTKGSEVKSIKAVDAKPGNWQGVVALSARPTEYQATSKSAVMRLQGGPVSYRVFLTQSRDVWSIEDLIEVSNS